MSRLVMVLADDDTPVTCANCEWQGSGRDLQEIRDYEDRVAAGRAIPAGECPECGALASVRLAGVDPVKQ